MMGLAWVLFCDLLIALGCMLVWYLCDCNGFVGSLLFFIYISMHVLFNQCVFIMMFSFIHPPIYSQWTPLIWLGFVLICRGLRGVNLCIIIYVYIYTTHILCNAHAHVYMCVHVCNVGVHVCNVGVHVCNVGVHALEKPSKQKKA